MVRITGVSRLAEVRRPHHIPKKILTLTSFGDYAQLEECKITALVFILFVVLSGRFKDSQLTIRLGELHLNAGYVWTLVTRLAGLPNL